MLLPALWDRYGPAPGEGRAAGEMTHPSERSQCVDDDSRHCVPELSLCDLMLSVKNPGSKVSWVVVVALPPFYRWES